MFSHDPGRVVGGKLLRCLRRESWAVATAETDERRQKLDDEETRRSAPGPSEACGGSSRDPGPFHYASAVGQDNAGWWFCRAVDSCDRWEGVRSAGTHRTPSRTAAGVKPRHRCRDQAALLISMTKPARTPSFLPLPDLAPRTLVTDACAFRQEEKAGPFTFHDERSIWSCSRRRRRRG